MDPVELFGARLRALRLERGLTQDALAAATGFDAADVRRYEAGRRDPGLRTLVRFAAALGTSPSDLIRDLHTSTS